MGVKHPKVKNAHSCLLSLPPPPPPTGLDVDSGTLTGVRCWRQLLAVQGLQSGLETDIHAYLVRNYAEQISHLILAKASIATV